MAAERQADMKEGTMFHIGAISDELSTDTEAALDLAVELGIGWIEVHTAFGAPVEHLAPEQITHLRELLAARDLRVCAISSTAFLRCHLDGRDDPIPPLPGFASVEGGYADHLNALERALAAAAALDAPLVRVFGFWKTGPVTDDVYPRAAEKLAQPVAMAQAAGIPLALETCPHTYFGHGRRAARLAAAVDSPWLRLLWDPAGSIRAGDPDVLGAYPHLRPFLAHVHARDIRVDPALPKGRAYCPIGEGQAPWREILTRLAQDGYGGAICLEPHFTAPDGRKEPAARSSYAGLQHTISLIGEPI
jgi:L-ribulose-5-phosphate 3-epimerase